MQFEFAVTAAISKKPYIKDNGDEPSTPIRAAATAAGFEPGSDINVSGYQIGDVSDTHFLAFNKFCMYRPHLLLLTKNGFKRQYDNLDLDDIQSAWNVLDALDWKYFLFFNCGKIGGCSRLHKHLQLTPYLPDRLTPWPATSSRPKDIPYEYILRRYDDSLGPKQLTDIYGQMVEEARHILALDPGSHVPHNFMLGRNWMLVIPRRNSNVGGAYSNTLGLLGMVSVASNDELRRWLDQGPLNVVAQLGVAIHTKDLTATD